MGVSIFLARVFGLYLVIMCLAVLFRTQYIQTAYDELVANKAHMLFGAVLSLIIGILIVVAHSVFVWDWRLLITLIGYLVLIKGIVLLFFPEHMIKLKSSIMSNRPVYYIIIIIFLLIGLFLAYKGFFCFGF
ncbi:MAG: hypothetical protein PVI75_02940 [Gammaproteobacteria bacterium]|jgi:hypothetical protein